MKKNIPINFDQITKPFKTLFFIPVPKTGSNYVLKVALKHQAEHLPDKTHNPFFFKIRRMISRPSNNKKIYFINHPVCMSKPPDIGKFDRAWKETCLHNDYFKKSLVFSIVRNPFDLLVSMYKYGFPYRPPQPNKPKPWMDIIGFPFNSFEEFVKAYCDQEYPWIVKYQQNFLFFQLFDDNGVCQPHFILRTEYLDEGLRLLCEPFGIKPLKSDNYVNPSRNHLQRDYKQFYNNKLRKLVEMKCKRELEAFGYSFEGDDGKVIIDPHTIKYNPHTDEFQMTKNSSKES